MENIIIKGFLKEFADNFMLENLREEEQFEHFVNYCSVKRIATNDFELENISVGKDGNPGIDGFTIIVNERVVTSKKDIDYFISSFGQIDVEFVFIQSKTSAKFDLGEILKFIASVKNCFITTEQISFNNEMSELIEIKDYIYEKAADLKEAPRLKLIFGTTGNWQEPADIIKLIRQGVDEIEKTFLFSSVDFAPVDSSKLQQYYKDIRNRSEKEIDFRDHTILPQIETVAEAYLGIVSSSEFVKLITDEEGYILKSIFYDNVRDYQGMNPVNCEIAETVKSKDDQNKFCILNNGVTIVAKSLSKIGTKFILRDFQIVNGCQTSHIIYEYRELLGKELFVPIKIIVTTDIETTNKIIQATNRQTEVKTEAFESLKPFHKELEDFYLSMKDSGGDHPIFYERRSKQYIGEKLLNDQIITLTRQIKSFLAMFLNDPHSVSRYYGELLSSYRKKIFQAGHSKFPYYSSTLTNTYLEKYLRRKGRRVIDKGLKPHLLMIIRIKMFGVDVPKFSSNKIDQQCKELVDCIILFVVSMRIVDESIEILNETIKLHADEKRNLHQIKALTKDLIEALSGQANNQDSESQKSIINYYNDERGFGFIKNTPEDLFFHISNVDYSHRGNLRKGAEATFFIEIDEKEKQNVILEVVE